MNTQVSPYTQEIINHFGPNALSLLNTYSCALEDFIIESFGEDKIPLIKERMMEKLMINKSLQLP